MLTSIRGLRTRLLRLAAGAAAAAALLLTGAAPARAAAVVGDAGCLANTLPAEDDVVSDAAELGFSIKFGGEVYTRAFVDTNGHVRLKPTDLLWWQLRTDWSGIPHDIPLIAPFHADADPRGAASKKVTYGQVDNYLGTGRRAFCVNWVDVGYFDTQDDKLNSFQLVLVDGPGDDFDIVFNYDKIQWESGSSPGSVGGIGGTFQPRVGYFDGANGIELPGSRTSLALLDSAPNGLIHGSMDANFVAGRYVLPIAEGGPSPLATGRVLDPSGNPVAGAAVQACSLSNACSTGLTDASGAYSLRGFTAAEIAASPFWSLKVFPPQGLLLLPPEELFFFFPSGPNPVAAVDDAVLRPLVGLPSGAELTPSNPGGPGGLPVVYWLDPLFLRVQSCPGAIGKKYVVSRNGEVLANGPASEPSPGVYEASIPSLHPGHGFVEIRMDIVCPGGGEGDVAFNAYIDPSGFVLDTRGAPLVGARVTLYRSPAPEGPFEPVPDGSVVMSPSNRSNPSYTDERGHFGWDVMSGYYVVRAEKEGCNAPGLPDRPYVETDVLPVPPEWLDLELVLDCEAVTPPVVSVPAGVEAIATSSQGALVSYEAHALDGGVEIPVACSPPPGSAFALGATQVVCAATDAHGNASQATFEVRVAYAFGGVLPPLDPDGDNVMKVGSKVPIAFALAGASAGIADASAELVVEPLAGGPALRLSPAAGRATADEGPGDLADRGAEGAAVAKTNCGEQGELFCYEECDDRYVYQLATKGMAPGDYRLHIDLGDGVDHSVKLTLVKKKK